MQILETLNPEHVTKTEWSSYPVREAARAVVVDDQKNVALLHVTKHGYYKLPGGGIELSEDKHTALKRECLEEIGCTVAVTAQLGTIIEHRKFCSLTQISYCYCAEVRGAKGEPHFMEDEVEDGFEIVWAPYTEALALLASRPATDLESSLYIVPRDLMFLQAAQDKIVSLK